MRPPAQLREAPVVVVAEAVAPEPIGGFRIGFEGAVGPSVGMGVGPCPTRPCGRALGSDGCHDYGASRQVVILIHTQWRIGHHAELPRSDGGVVSRSDVTPEEATRVRAALALLRARTGRLDVLAKALRFERATVRRVIAGTDPVTASMVLRVARLAQVGVDEVLAGRFPPPGTCPHCGHRADEAAGWRSQVVLTSALRLEALEVTRRGTGSAQRLPATAKDPDRR